MIDFLDASALVMRYVGEPGADVVRWLLRRGRPLAASRLSAVEVASALARRARTGDLPATAARDMAESAVSDLAGWTVVEPRGAVLDLAAQLVWRCDLRAYDAVQLASALRLALTEQLPVRFVAGDVRLCAAAASQGLRTLRVGRSGAP